MWARVSAAPSSSNVRHDLVEGLVLTDVTY
jgi:hypothetical protein